MEDPFIEILVFFRHLGWEALAPRESVTSVAVVLHLAHHQIGIWVSFSFYLTNPMTVTLVPTAMCRAQDQIYFVNSSWENG